jgi:hypothetical protein
LESEPLKEVNVTTKASNVSTDNNSPKAAETKKEAGEDLIADVLMPKQSS